VATDRNPRDMTFEEWDRWRRETGRINRRPLSREEAMRWQLQEYANRNPTAKELEIRQALADVLDLNDALAELNETGNVSGLDEDDA